MHGNNSFNKSRAIRYERTRVVTKLDSVVEVKVGDGDRVAYLYISSFCFFFPALDDVLNPVPVTSKSHLIIDLNELLHVHTCSLRCGFGRLVALSDSRSCLGQGFELRSRESLAEALLL